MIFLTANDLEKDTIKGYELGASDYITKPFSNSVLRHKVRAIFSLLDNAREPAHVVFDDGSLRIDFSAMHTWLNGEEIMPAPLEYRMLEIFIQNKGILLTRQRLLSGGADCDFQKLCPVPPEWGESNRISSAGCCPGYA